MVFSSGLIWPKSWSATSQPRMATKRPASNSPGVIVRPVAGYGMPTILRVSIGTEAENTRFLDALRKALGR